MVDEPIADVVTRALAYEGVWDGSQMGHDAVRLAREVELLQQRVEAQRVWKEVYLRERDEARADLRVAYRENEALEGQRERLRAVARQAGKPCDCFVEQELAYDTHTCDLRPLLDALHDGDLWGAAMKPHRFEPQVELETTAIRRCAICGRDEWDGIHGSAVQP